MHKGKVTVARELIVETIEILYEMRDGKQAAHAHAVHTVAMRLARVETLLREAVDAPVTSDRTRPGRGPERINS